MTTNAPQLATSSTHARHDHGPDVFCLRCLDIDLEQNDFRGDLALLFVAQMNRLARLRSANGRTSADAFHGALNAEALMKDIVSSDADRRIAAIEMREVLCDYLQHRVILLHPEPRPLKFAQMQHDMAARTRERLEAIADEGREPDLFAPIN
jgi:hypothetical protein